MPRFYLPASLRLDQVFELTDSAARHLQVLRLQPGDFVTLFNGGFVGSSPVGGEFIARIDRMGRREVQLTVQSHQAIERESHREIHLALAVPANDRMDWLVEKATELGVSSIQPLFTQRSVVRMDADRATKKIAHWQSIAIAACEQCGRNQVPPVHPVLSLADWMVRRHHGHHFLLSLSHESISLPVLLKTIDHQPLFLLSGPEGGFSPDEELAACSAGFSRISLGPRVLRADTAPLAALSALTLSS